MAFLACAWTAMKTQFQWRAAMYLAIAHFLSYYSVADL